MVTCSVRWRPSSGRGEFEYVPSGILDDKNIILQIPVLQVSIDSAIHGESINGKPRLRKRDRGTRQNLHLPQLVMALARLPDPARQLRGTIAETPFPLERKQYLVGSLDFDVVEDDDDENIHLEPLRISIYGTDVVIDLSDRFVSIAKDIEKIDEIRNAYPALAEAIDIHKTAILKGTNSNEIRERADAVLKIQADIFGVTNAASALTLIDISKLSPAESEEDFSAKEGRILFRTHVYRERNRSLVSRAKRSFRSKNGGKLFCEVCSFEPEKLYGKSGERCIEAHHIRPVSQLQPDTNMSVHDMAMVCANCHRFIHTRTECYSLSEVRDILMKASHQNQGK